MTSWLQLLLFGLLLSGAQVAVALPWIILLNWTTLRTRFRQRNWPLLLRGAGGVLLTVLGLGVLGAVALRYIRDTDRLQFVGRIYGAVLHGQLIIAGFIIAFTLLLWVWPKGGAVALAAFREGLRQAAYWLLALAAVAMLAVISFIPYFTFGEELKMVKELGYDLVMLPALVFGVYAAGESIHEEFEGRTAITLMSKPLSRRQFLLGKFVGILLAVMVMTWMLGWGFDWVKWFKGWYEADQDLEPVVPPNWVGLLAQRAAPWGEITMSFLFGVGLWFGEALDTLPGLVLGFCQVMVLLAIGVALVTRVPKIVTWVTCLVLFMLGHLAPVLVQIAERMRQPPAQPSATADLVYFMAQLFNALLPALEFFNLGPIIARDVLPDPLDYALYIGSVVLYAVMYTAIVLLVGLVLFEDRDLA
jgi:ABC-type transport system involved in multi-copper enzyme maturation permease subunit